MTGGGSTISDSSTLPTPDKAFKVDRDCKALRSGAPVSYTGSIFQPLRVPEELIVLFLYSIPEFPDDRHELLELVDVEH